MSGTIKPERLVLTLAAASEPEKRPRLSLDDRAWREGFRYGEQSRQLRACPYVVTSTGRWSWSSSYTGGKAARPSIDADAKRLTNLSPIAARGLVLDRVNSGHQNVCSWG